MIYFIKGVTTQCKNLSENLNYEHISIAEIVNSFAQKNDSRAKLIKELYDEANVLPIVIFNNNNE